ncbi:hypothetical protein [Salipaludibacillus daqingensis]|uniref:hypothetical protein n=1 Tax=Salipaludibacillus daqingensis TaxID=3041001 RepID=UPI002477217A|nr:hypothetical protein [Salipaludibacillus daqingensis]
MEIQGQQVNVQSKTNERPIQMREGEVYRARIESRVSDREAIISIRGQEVKAKFEGKVPERDRVNIQVQERSSDGVRVREIRGESQQGQQRESGSSAGRETQSADRVLRDMGIRQPSGELRQATQRMMDRGVPLTRETVNDLNRYLQSDRGTERQRMQTIDVMAQKRLEPSGNQIRAVHEALHGNKVSDQVRRITGSSRSDRSHIVSSSQHAASSNSREAILRAVDQVRTALQTGNNVRQSIEQLQQVVQRNGDSAMRQTVNQALREMIQLQAQSGRETAAGRMEQLAQQLSQSITQTGNLLATSQPTVSSSSSSSVQNWSTMIQNQPNLTAAIETVRNEMDQQLSRPIAESLERSLTKALTELDSGRELKARQTVQDALNQVQQMMPNSTSQDISQSRIEMQEYVRNEIIQASGLSSKSILITEVTERLAQATDEFKVFQRDTAKQLHRIETMIQQFRQNAVQQTKPMLENVIKQMDRAIMKSDFMLFADMKTERTLLGASSKLADAKRLLVQGKHSDARQIVRQVQQTMDQIKFQPSNQRVQHMISEEKQWNEPKAQVHRLSQQMEQTTRTFLNHDGSSRQIFEGIRGMGLNREAELAQIFAAGKGIPTEAQQRNLKTILMNIARGEEESARGQQQQAQQTLQSLSGSQLLNRNDTQQNQMHLFQLPLMIKGESENLQVYINSRNEQESLDWENCNLYFHIDTKSLGPLGISLNVTERSLNVTLKNDTEGFAESVEPLGQKYIDQLKEVGYQVNKLKISPMTVEENNPTPDMNTKREDEKLAVLPIMTEEGFDYKI